MRLVTRWTLACLAVALFALSAPASAQSKPAPKPKPKPAVQASGGLQPVTTIDPGSQSPDHPILRNPHGRGGAPSVHPRKRLPKGKPLSKHRTKALKGKKPIFIRKKGVQSLKTVHK